MTILMTSDMPGVTEEVYGHLAAALLPVMRASEGFRSHAAGPIDGGCRVTELWGSEETWRAWYHDHVVPMMAPDGAAPSVTIHVITTTATHD